MGLEVEPLGGQCMAECNEFSAGAANEAMHHLVLEYVPNKDANHTIQPANDDELSSGKFRQTLVSPKRSLASTRIARCTKRSDKDLLYCFKSRY